MASRETIGTFQREITSKCIVVLLGGSLENARSLDCFWGMDLAATLLDTTSDSLHSWNS